MLTVGKRPRIGDRLYGYRITGVRRGAGPALYYVTVNTDRVFLVRVEGPPASPAGHIGGGVWIDGDGPPRTALPETGDDPYGLPQDVA